MPTLHSDISIASFTDVKNFPDAVWEVLEAHPRPANVILPQALKARAEGQRKAINQSLWIVCSTDSVIEFILSVTEGPMGAYPAFIFTPLPFDRLSDDYIRPSIRSMVVALVTALHTTSRIYSVFSAEPIARIFADEWAKHTGIKAEQLYYAAKLSYCTIDTLDKRSSTVDMSRGYLLRPAVREDIEAIGELCYFFASESHPFTLTKARARTEASLLVEKKQVWVHEAKGSGGKKEIASIVAFTRNSDRFVQTRGGNGRDVQNVSFEDLLTGPNCKESVVLYVAHDNIAANVVYDRVGFAGLAKGGPKVAGVEPWLEFGFDRKKVVLGHW
ncbi:hypothetical protein DXG01_010797 [Tephrocybe rancida]|nr:hypothetical protein DXG01_010797 [Tephrocybe rancida]